MTAKTKTKVMTKTELVTEIANRSRVTCLIIIFFFLSISFALADIKIEYKSEMELSPITTKKPRIVVTKFIDKRPSPSPSAYSFVFPGYGFSFVHTTYVTPQKQFTGIDDYLPWVLALELEKLGFEIFINGEVRHKKKEAEGIINGEINEFQISLTNYWTNEYTAEVTFTSEIYSTKKGIIWRSQVKGLEKATFLLGPTKKKRQDMINVAFRKAVGNLFKKQDFLRALEEIAEEKDIEPPQIIINYPQKEYISRTSVILLEGLITDENNIKEVKINRKLIDCKLGKNVTLKYPIIVEDLEDSKEIYIEAIDENNNLAKKIIKITKGDPVTGLIASVGVEDVILNIGSQQGVENNMAFQIKSPEVIKDPETGKILGKTIRVLGIIKVVQVEEKMSKAIPLLPNIIDKIRVGDKIQ